MQKQPERHTKEQKKVRIYGPVATEYGAGDTGSWRAVRPDVNFPECIQCGTCERFCPTNIITVYKNKEECVTFDFDYCKGCGICANVCPKQCIEMIPERSED